MAQHAAKEIQLINSSEMQKTLDSKQIEAFYIHAFEEDQVSHFLKVIDVNLLDKEKVVVDIGGGCGFFAKRLHETIGKHVRVIDSDPISITTCKSTGVDGVLGDALSPEYAGDEEVVCFNLMLHHLVGRKERDTRDLQQNALKVWINRAKFIFVHEYIYDSYVGNLTGRLIYEITKNKFLSAVGCVVGTFVPSLRANTFGVGVRFRAHGEWVELFEEIGFRVVSTMRGEDEEISLPRRLLLIKSRRRDSFLLAHSNSH